METMIWPILKMVLFLGVLAAGFYVLTRWLKRKGTDQPFLLTDSGIRVLSTQPIAPQKYISLVEVGTEVLALGVSEAHITLLTKVDDKELIGRLEAQRSARPDLFPFLRLMRSPLGPKRPKTGFLRRGYGN